MKCHFCNTEIPSNVRLCPCCQGDVGFPNVRAAQVPAEKEALAKRLRDAMISVEARGCRHVAEAFRSTSSESRAVFCRSLDIVTSLVSSKNLLYISFHQQVNAGARLPKDDDWERGRVAVEGTLFPHYHSDINYACLTINNRGLTNYGKYSIILKNIMIKDRASVFEENPFLFMEKHRVIAGRQIPEGYRATWPDREVIAISKLHSKLDMTTKEDGFPSILISEGDDSASDEYIEVHIYGPIHANAFERIVGPKPDKGSDVVLWKSLERKCRDLGITLEVCV